MLLWKQYSGVHHLDFCHLQVTVMVLSMWSKVKRVLKGRMKERRKMKGRKEMMGKSDNMLQAVWRSS